ncbi:endonuclease [Candidatus Uhrbacteria bacterium]|nr:endonuclease [Candidatus Uhrbacteria bacterium]
MDVLAVYHRLYNYFGPQHWWPVSQAKSYKLKADSSFEICVGAILTQNTAWKNVERTIANLHLADAMNPAAIIKMPKNKLASLIRPAGYFNQKAKKLKIFSNWYLKNKIPAREELLSLWGIGPETADSILLYGYNQPSFVIDAYTKRLCGHLKIKYKNYDEYKKFFESRLPKSEKMFNEYHALIVAWGKLLSKDRDQAANILTCPKINS